MKKMSFNPVVGVIGFIALIIVVVMFVKSVHTVAPGEKAVVFYELGSGLDTENVIGEGMVLIAPWNSLITYDVRQKNVDMTMLVLDKNGLEVGIDISVVYRPLPASIGKLHLKTGADYEEIVVIPRTRAAGREVTGKYDAQELYSSKRDMLQSDIETILSTKFEQNFLMIEDILIRDVNLPKTIKIAIETKQEQEQKNKIAESVKIEAQSKADAVVITAQGKKDSDILVAEGKAQAMKLQQLELRKSPEYTNYIKWKNYSEKGVSPYGENNIFGSNAASVIKGLK